MELTDEEKARYSRHILLGEVGKEGQLKLKSAKVLVIGAGGLGCPVLLYLAAAGVGTIGIIDFDLIDVSNLQRQVLFDSEDIGLNKAEVAKNKLEAKNPLIVINAYNFALTNKNAIDLFSQYDIIVDGTDNFSTRYMVNDACLLTNKPLVYGAIHKFEGQVSVFNLDGGPTYRCLFPNPPAANSVPSCSDVGVIGILPGVIGTQQANEVIKIILGIGSPLSGRLLIYNALEASFMEVKISKTSSLESEGITTRQVFEVFNYEFYCGLVDEVINNITKEEFNKLPQETFVLDVRESWEQPQIVNKHVLNAPLDDLDDYIDEIPKDKEIYVVCQKGSRSKSAITYLIKEYKFTNLINLEGGIIS